MSPKLFKILLLTILTIGIVILGVMLARAKNKKDAAEIAMNIENPFGLDTSNTSFPNGGNQDPTLPGQSGVDQTPSVTIKPIDFIIAQETEIFKKLSSEPVAGMTFVYVEREKKVPEEVSTNLVEGYDFSGYPMLKFGDDRGEVTDLKTVLNRQNPSPGLTIDTAFDTDLKNAVIDFQARNSLTPDGVVGRGTYQKLNDFQGIKPTSGKGPEKETIEFVRYVDRANGYIYDKTTRLDESSVMISNTALPRVYEAYFGSQKDSVFMRYLSGSLVENLVAKIVKPVIDSDINIGSLDSSPMPSAVTFASLLPSAEKILYISRENSGSSVFTYDFKTKQTKKVWFSSFSEWLPQWVNENTLSLTTRSSGLFPGNSYILDIKNNSLKNVIKNVFGLTTNISPDGKKIIYSSYENNSLKTYLLDVAGGSIREFAPTTLPEKCVWTKDSKTIYCGAPASDPSGLYPDDWYKGLNLFSDLLWKVDAGTNTAKIILDKDRVPTESDMTNIIVNDKQDYLMFINKHDNNLYGIDLSKL